MPAASALADIHTNRCAAATDCTPPAVPAVRRSPACRRCHAPCRASGATSSVVPAMPRPGLVGDATLPVVPAVSRH
eukprot:351479-Chlamydomonas_euryale.AAC.5